MTIEIWTERMWILDTRVLKFRMRYDTSEGMIACVNPRVFYTWTFPSTRELTRA